MSCGIENDTLLLIEQHKTRNHFERISTCQSRAADYMSIVMAIQVKVISPITQILRGWALQFVIVNNHNHKIDFAGVQIESGVLAEVRVE